MLTNANTASAPVPRPAGIARGLPWGLLGAILACVLLVSGTAAPRMLSSDHAGPQQQQNEEEEQDSEWAVEIEEAVLRQGSAGAAPGCAAALQRRSTPGSASRFTVCGHRWSNGLLAPLRC